MFNSKRERYTLFSVALTASLLTLLFSSAYWAGAAGETTITEGSFRETASYVIWKDGSTYYAKDGSTGQVTSSTNCAYLVDALTYSSSAKTIVFRAGTYFFDTYIRCGNNTRIVGAGKQLTTLYLNNAKNQPLIVNTDIVNGNTGIEICDIGLYGNKDQQTTNSSNINFKHVTGFAINNILVSHSHGGGIFLDRCVKGSVTDCVCQDNFQFGIGLYGDMYDIIIDNNICDSNGETGIVISAPQDGSELAYDIIVSNNIAKNNGHNGINFFRYVKFSSITGNIATNNGAGAPVNHDGIMVEENCSYIAIVGNIATDNTYSGIQLYGAEYCTITGNIIKDNDDYGISIYNSSTNIINGNNIFDVIDVQDWGIKEWGATSFYNTFVSNTAFNCEVGGISIVGANTKVSDCWNGTTYIPIDPNIDIDFNQKQLQNAVFHKGATPPASPVEGQWFYDTDDHTLYVWNSTDWVSQVGSGVTDHFQETVSYVVWVDGSTYYAKDGDTGQTTYSSNASLVIENTVGACSVGDLIVIKKTVVYGTVTINVDTKLLVRNSGETVTEGQVLFYNTTDSESYKAKADSATTIGNGNDVYLCMWNSSDGQKTLLLENGYVANSGWSWSVGNTLWVSNATAGSMITSYPSDSGDQALQVGTAYNSTSIHFASSKTVIEIA